MNRWTSLLVALAVAIYLVPGCSGGGSPVTPAPDQELTSESNRTAQGRTHLWGYYDLAFDLQSRSLEAVPNRTVMFTANVVTFLNAAPAGFYVSFNEIIVDPDYIDVDVDVTISHPLNNEKFVGYDVRGIFVGNGSSSLAYNDNLVYSDQDEDQILLNADGYSRWFNPGEFMNPGLFGYTHGNHSSKEYTGTATLNPYKYFAEGLGPTDNLFEYLASGDPEVGYFLHGTSNTRNYVIRFPASLGKLKYGYAVVANWEGGPPEFHPSHAVEALALSVADNSTLYYMNEIYNGGELILDVSVFDWGSELSAGVMEDYGIIVESTVLSAPYVLNASEMTPIDSAANVNTYHVEIAAGNVTSFEGNEVWVIVEYPQSDYTNPFGVPNDAGTDALAAPFRIDLYVQPWDPPDIYLIAPNGGEEWICGTAEWISWWAPHGDTVFIEYSKDNFVADVHTIATAIYSQDEEFMWDPIPFDPSDTIRVRITFTSFPEYYDVSDADFTLLEPFITVLSPNGGEEWEYWSSHDITWSSQYVSGTVNIEYSNDNFVSDINPIALDEDNDGSYTWDPVPPDASDTVRVRVSWTDYPGVNDVSDDDFSIVDFGWARTWGGSDWDEGFGVASDGSGGIYVTGYFKETVDFDPGGGDPHTSNGARDVFLSKFDSSGNFEWARTWGGLDSDGGFGVAADGSGNVYVTGYFQSWVVFNPDDGDLHISNGEEDVFLSKFDSSGNFEWARTWGGSEPDFGYEAAVDGSGNAYVVGYFQDTVDFDPGGGDPHTSKGYDDVFLSKFDSSGSFEWARTWGGGAEHDYGYGVAADGPNHVYVTGTFGGTADFDPGGGDLRTSNGASDVFLSKFDSSGIFGWARTWGGSSSDEGNGLAADGPLNVYVTGYFQETVDFDPGGGDPHTSYGYDDVFLSKFDSLGNFGWARTWGGLGCDWSWGVAADGPGNVYVTGYFILTVDFDPDGGDPHTTNGFEDIFLSKFDSSGNFEWARTWGGTDWDRGLGVCADGSGNVYTTGYFDSTGGFAPTDPPCNEDPDEHTSNGDYDAFLTRHLPDGCW